VALAGETFIPTSVHDTPPQPGHSMTQDRRTAQAPRIAHLTSRRYQTSTPGRLAAPAATPRSPPRELPPCLHSA
jgi:hypothetical protein